MSETNSGNNGAVHIEKTINTLYWISLMLLFYTMFLLTAEAFKLAVRSTPDLSQWYLMILGTYATLKRVSRWKDGEEKDSHCGHILVYIFWYFSGTMIGFFWFLPDTIFVMPDQMVILTSGITGIYFGSSVVKTLNVKKNNENNNNSNKKTP